MKYGLTQEVISNTRERFKSGELTYEEAMWFLKFDYQNNKDYHWAFTVKDKQIETLIEVLKK